MKKSYNNQTFQEKKAILSEKEQKKEAKKTLNPKGAS
jgi:hypothetical protein